MYIIFRLLLSFVHFVYNLYYFIKQQYTSFVLFIERFRQPNKHNYSLLKSNVHLNNVPKIPRHLAILLGHEEASVVDLAKLISWCVVAEIPYVSFYDHKEILKKKLSLVKKKLEELEPSLAKSVEWSSGSGKPTNGVKIVGKESRDLYSEVKDVSRHKTKVQFLSYADCKGKIVTLTQSLAKLNDSSDFQEDSITPEFLDQKLKSTNGAPDPDLAIVCGETMCTYGFMPWQARITEFFLLPTHHDLSSDSFVRTLVKFSECQQRYGK